MTPPPSMTGIDFKNWWRWWQDNWGIAICLFLLAFIPLFPKIPLYSPIEEYIVRVRWEDVLILLASLGWIWGWRWSHQQWRSPVAYGMLSYALAGLLSVISAIFIIHTVPWQPIHLTKTILHFLRYLEYFVLFFVMATNVNNLRRLKLVVAILAVTIMLLAGYGVGQKYYYWPVYSTMNREFSKGIRLYLTEHARVQSTFAGHYDLGAYLVIVLPIILALSLRLKSNHWRWPLYLTQLAGLWLLVVSASRTSFIGYLVAGCLTVWLVNWSSSQQFWAKLKQTLMTEIIFGGVVLLMFGWFGEDIYERFLQLLQASPTANASYHNLNKTRKDLFDQYFLIPLHLKKISLPVAKPPANGLSTQQAAQIILESDTRPVPSQPADVYENIPDRVVIATRSAEGIITNIIVDQPRVFSDNAEKWGLSLAIRLDSLWPQAIQAFRKYPLIGSGYATLNKRYFEEFTSADSTDNNYLRTLGETGLLGFITFYGTILIAFAIANQARQQSHRWLSGLAAGYMAGVIGLLINAVYIDVFAASKVAHSFWAITGLVCGYYYINQASLVNRGRHVKKRSA